MPLLTSQRLTLVFLSLSAALGVEILAEEAIIGSKGGRYLLDPAVLAIWAPIPHAYGLIAFVAIDIVVAGLVWKRGRGAASAAFVWGILQFLGMALDPLSLTYFSAFWPSVASFASYLFGIWGFDARLALQIPLVVFAFKARRQLAKPTAV